MPSVCPSPPKNVVIVGGGVIGLSIAWEMALRGRQVTVIERGAPLAARRPASSNQTQTTSWTAAGILPPANFHRATDPLEKLRGFSHERWPKWAETLKQTTGIDPGFARCGGYYLAETAGEAASLIGMRAYWQELDIDCRSVSQSDLLKQHPWLEHWCRSSTWIQKQPDQAAWWVPDEHQVRPPRLLKSLHAACKNLDVDLRYGEEVADLSKLKARFPGQAIVCCGGTATGLVDERLQLREALIPIRGQMLLLKCDDFREPFIFNVGNRYLISRGDSLVLAGSCEEEVGFDSSTTEDEINKIRQFASGLSPELTNATEIQRWAGLRPMTFDGFPMIGRVPNHDDLFVAAGHYRSGIHFAPATAVAMADILDDQPTFMDMTAFSVGRQQAAHDE